MIDYTEGGKFKEGDAVRIVNYGQPIWFNKEEYHWINGANKPKNLLQEDEDKYWVDLSPELIGTESVITKISFNQGKYSYALIKRAWFSDNQLEKI